MRRFVHMCACVCVWLFWLSDCLHGYPGGQGGDAGLRCGHCLLGAALHWSRRRGGEQGGRDIAPLRTGQRGHRAARGRTARPLLANVPMCAEDTGRMFLLACRRDCVLGWVAAAEARHGRVDRMAGPSSTTVKGGDRRGQAANGCVATQTAPGGRWFVAARHHCGSAPAALIDERSGPLLERHWQLCAGPLPRSFRRPDFAWVASSRSASAGNRRGEQQKCKERQCGASAADTSTQAGYTKHTHSMPQPRHGLLTETTCHSLLAPENQIVPFNH